MQRNLQLTTITTPLQPLILLPFVRKDRFRLLSHPGALQKLLAARGEQRVPRLRSA